MCLTYADKLYAELMDKDGKHPNSATAKLELVKQTEVSNYNTLLCNTLPLYICLLMYKCMGFNVSTMYFLFS